MSVTHVKRIAKTRSAVDYELYGARGSKKYRDHKAAGTDRVAAMTCDCGSPEEFVARAEALAAAHGRKVEARSLIQSFSKGEFDPDNPEDVARVNELGYEWAKRLHPNSDVLVITHIDGHGGHPHNHIKILNHDNVTGKALQGNHLHWMVSKVNDELMREQGLEVLVRQSREKDGREVTSRDQGSYWEQDRNDSKFSDFDRQLGDQIEEALVDPRSVDTASFREVLAESGVELVEKKYTIAASTDGKTPEHESIGWTYKGLDETGSKRRIRRRKASSLSNEFTHEGAQEVFEINQQLAQKQAQTALLSGVQTQTQTQTPTQEIEHGREGTTVSDAGRTGGTTELGAVERIDVDALAAAVDAGAAGRDRGDRDESRGDAEREHPRHQGVDLASTRDKLRSAAERDRTAAEERKRGRRNLEAAQRDSVGQSSREAPRRRDGEAKRPRRPLSRPRDERTSGGYDLER